MTLDKFEEETNKYDLELEKSMLSPKNDYDKQELSQIRKMCEEISEITTPTPLSYDEIVKEELLGPYFIRSVGVLDNFQISAFFIDAVRKMKLYRDRNFGRGETEINYRCSNINNNLYVMSLPTGELTMSEQMGYGHEMGHIPHLDKPRDDFLEYSEALPIFMEYLVALRRTKDPKLAFDYFLCERLPIEKTNAISILKVYDEIINSKNIEQKYYIQLFQKYYKYLESLEFAIQLIDAMNQDKIEVVRELEKVINGFSMESTADNLDINSYGCKRLLQEFKRMAR